MSNAETQQASPDEIYQLLLQGEVIRLPLDVLPTFLANVTGDYQLKVRYNETEALVFTEETEQRLDAEADRIEREKRIEELPISRLRIVDPETGAQSKNILDADISYSHNDIWEVSLWFVMPEDVAGSPILCPFTGLPDAKGEPLYFGDVLIHPDDPGFPMVETVWFKGAFKLKRVGESDLRIAFLQGDLSGWLEVYQIIGNRWMSSEELERRAAELRNKSTPHAKAVDPDLTPLAPIRDDSHAGDPPSSN